MVLQATQQHIHNDTAMMMKITPPTLKATFKNNDKKKDTDEVCRGQGHAH